MTEVQLTMQDLVSFPKHSIWFGVNNISQPNVYLSATNSVEQELLFVFHEAQNTKVSPGTDLFHLTM